MHQIQNHFLIYRQTPPRKPNQNQATKEKREKGKAMQQERDRGGTEEMKQNQDRRLKPLQVENQQQQQQQQQQPQKCPRCESLNTKFCYYNNYSLSQPRYFCKTCRRYWTQGGTLRNVPVGGGCRKGKRTKTSSSGENSRSQPQQPPQTHQNLTSSTFLSTNPATLRAKEPINSASPAIPSITSLYPGGGFLSSLAAIQSLNQPQAYNQNLSVGGDLGASSNLGLLQGFNVPSFSSQQHHQIQQAQFYQMDNRDKNMEPLYPSEEGLIQSRRVPSSQHDWHQSFVNNSIPISDAALWSINSSTTTRTTGNNNSNTAGSSMNPNHWPDLPGYGPPP